MKISFLLVVLASMVLFSMEAQSNRTAINSPFVSRIDAEVKGSEVILSWDDSPDIQSINEGSYQILRSLKPIFKESLADAKVIAKVNPGIQTYTDTPKKGEEWWYAVQAIFNNRPVSLFFPWRNSMNLPVLVDADIFGSADVTRVLSLTAQNKKTSVFLSFVAEEANRDIVIYRSPVPLNTPESLENSVWVGHKIGISGNILDNPLPGMTWYYTALDRELAETGSINWIELAAFSGAVILPPSDFGEERESLRSAPLPLLRLSNDTTGGDRLSDRQGFFPPRTQLGRASEQAVFDIIGLEKGVVWNKPNAQILPIDKAERGEEWNEIEQKLKDVLNKSFAEEEWKTADSELAALSASDGLSELAKARISFYRGQCRYFMNNLQSSFLYFLVAKENYSVESEKWIKRIREELNPLQ